MQVRKREKLRELNCQSENSRRAPKTKCINGEPW